MINNSKLSKVMLLAGALVFTSFCSKVSLAEEAVELNVVSVSGVGQYEGTRDAANASRDAQVEYNAAQQAYKKAQEDYNHKVAEQQKTVQAAKARCDNNPNDCADYDSARKKLTEIQNDKTALNEAREAVNTANKNVKSTGNAASDAIYKAQKDANKDLKNANKDINKYCGDGKKADAEKCAAARENKQKAELKLQQIAVSERAATGQTALTQAAIEARDTQVEANKSKINELNSQKEDCNAKSGTEKQTCLRKNQEIDSQIKDLDTYNKGVEQAKNKENGGEDKSSEAIVNEASKTQSAYKEAKENYSAAAKSLAECYASKGKNNCEAEKNALEEARKEANDAYQAQAKAQSELSGLSESDKAGGEYASASTAVEEANKKKQTACADDPSSDECKRAEKDLKDAQAAFKQAEKKQASAKVADLENLVTDKQSEYESLQAQLAEAQQACEYSSKLTSKAGKADAEKYCAQAAQLEQQVNEAAAELDALRAQEEEARNEAAELGAEGLEGDHKGEVYQAFSTAKNKDGSMFKGEYVGSGDFSNTTDIFKTMTRRAMRILVGLKPIVYTFAGFGLIGFAWMAIFNKISWKWFANIAMGLFLVANMGRFIEYFVYNDYFEGDKNYVVGEQLSFGDYLREGYADTKYDWIPEISAYMPPKAIGEEEIPDVGIDVPETKTNTRGFCQAEKKGGGLFGGGGFMSCVKDLVAAGKKAVDTAKKVQNTVNTVKSTVDQVKSAAQNIGDAAQMIGKGNLEDTFTALGKIGQNVNAMVGASGGMVNGIMSNVSSITNNIQDMGKSRDEVAELNEKRARGEATNKIDAALKGQKIDDDGNVERLWGGLDKNGNQKEGKIAGNSNILTGIQDTTKDVVSKSRELNGQYQDAMSTAGNLTGAVGNFSAFGSKSINQTIQEKRTAKQQAKNQAAAQQAAAENKAKRTAQQEAAAGREAVNKATPAVSGQAEYASAVQKAQSTEQTAKNRESTAVNAQKDATAKQQTADKLNQAAQAAKKQAEKSGTAEDKRAAELAAQRANIAQAQADAAKTKADSSKAAAEEARKQADTAKEKADSLRGGAVSEGIDKAKETQENAAQTIEQAEKAIAESKAGLSAQQAAVSKADAALQEAIKKARESGSDADYREVGRLQNQKKEAETALKQTQQNIAAQEAAKVAAERAAAEARVKQAQLEAEKDSGLTQDKISQMESEDEQAERLRQKYARNNTASAQAKAAETKAGQAQTAAENAKITAEAKVLAAQRAAQAAAAARAKAVETGTLEDQRAAELASRRAELAENEAQAAKDVVKEREAEAEELTKASVSASLNETQYLQSYYEREMSEAETAIAAARAEISVAQAETAAAQEEVNRTLDEAKRRNDTASIMAAKAAADKLAQKKEVLRKAQKELENQIKRRNSAQKSYYDAQEREAELRGQSQR